MISGRIREGEVAGAGESEDNVKVGKWGFIQGFEKIIRGGQSGGRKVNYGFFNGDMTIYDDFVSVEVEISISVMV